jgi:hypothetical protein
MEAYTINQRYTHVLPQHTILIILRIIQLLLAATLIGLSAYGVSRASTSGFDLTLFSVCDFPIFLLVPHFAFIQSNKPSPFVALSQSHISSSPPTAPYFTTTGQS